MKAKFMCLLLVLAVLAAMTAGCQPKATEQEIRVGFMTDLSGPTAAWGQTFNNSLIMAVDKINADGGLLGGKKLKVITYDNKATVPDSLTAYSRLVDQDKVVAVIGPANSSIMIAMAPIADEKKVPVLSGAMDERATNPSPGVVYKYHFLWQPSASQQAEAVASYAMNEMGIKTVAVLYDQGNAYSVSLAAPFVNYYLRHGGTILSNESFQSGTKDFHPQLTKIKQLNPDALHITGYVADNTLIAQQARELGMNMPIIGNNSCNPPYAENAGAAANGTVYPITIAPTDPRAPEKAAAYKARWGQDPVGGTQNLFGGNDHVLIIADAIKRAGKADPVAIRDALESSKDVFTWIANWTMDAGTHRPLGFPLQIVKIEDGKYNIVNSGYIPKY